MKKSFAFALAVITLSSFSILTANNNLTQSPKAPPPKIQVAILLDVSNSMDGLIDQAKAQLWNMVNILGKSRCDGVSPKIEISLYEYGRTTNDEKNGYVKQLLGFSSNLDTLSEILFSLKTNGGDEYCGQVIMNSLNELDWDKNTSSYKTIFIAGNEDFLQGRVLYKNACAIAKKKGVIVNTIYCGSRSSGIREHWNINDECGGGSFTNINQDESVDDIPTPYDNEILALNEKLNDTYVSYGASGSAYAASQKALDKKNYEMSKSVAVKRTMAKSQKNLYKNSDWDLVDKAEEDGGFINKLDPALLPDSLKGKSKEQIKAFVSTKKNERAQLQIQIAEKSNLRSKYIEDQTKNENKGQTLESEIEKIIINQAKGFKIIIK